MSGSAPNQPLAAGGLPIRAAGDASDLGDLFSSNEGWGELKHLTQANQTINLESNTVISRSGL